MTKSFEKLEKQIGHAFENKDLLREALTHSSTGEDKDYERLEFLGDRVLGLVMADYLYAKFPDEAEGDLAKRLAALVQGSLLAEVAGEVGLGNYILFSDAEKAAGGAENDNILADVFEALLGAIYLDAGSQAGFEKCRTLIEKYWEGRFDKMVRPPLHPKTRVQEWAQGKGLPLPVYEIVEQSGPDHAPVFCVRLSLEGYKPVTAEGRTRQAAEKEAAMIFMRDLDE